MIFVDWESLVGALAVASFATALFVGVIRRLGRLRQASRQAYAAVFLGACLLVVAVVSFVGAVGFYFSNTSNVKEKPVFNGSKTVAVRPEYWGMSFAGGMEIYAYWDLGLRRQQIFNVTDLYLQDIDMQWVDDHHLVIRYTPIEGITCRSTPTVDVVCVAATKSSSDMRVDQP